MKDVNNFFFNHSNILLVLLQYSKLSQFQFLCLLNIRPNRLHFRNLVVLHPLYCLVVLYRLRKSRVYHKRYCWKRKDYLMKSINFSSMSLAYKPIGPIPGYKPMGFYAGWAYMRGNRVITFLFIIQLE